MMNMKRNYLAALMTDFYRQISTAIKISGRVPNHAQLLAMASYSVLKLVGSGQIGISSTDLKVLQESMVKEYYDSAS